MIEWYRLCRRHGWIGQGPPRVNESDIEIVTRDPGRGYHTTLDARHRLGLELPRGPAARKLGLEWPGAPPKPKPVAPADLDNLPF